MLVAGVDSSTQSCKVVVVDADSGRLVRHGRTAHPPGTEVDPEAWWQALQQALAEAGGLAGVSALSVGGQQHGMVCLDESGAVVRPAMLWNDTRSAGAARSLVEERGAAFWAETVGSVPVASFTITKLRWLREHEPDAAARVASVCLPHDWLTWRLLGSSGLDELVTDRSDASGTGYWSAGNGYHADLFEQALGHEALRPRVLGPQEAAGCVDDVVIGPGAGDNAASALGLGARPGDVIVSVGTSGVACAVSEVAPADPTGLVAGFCDATGRYLPLVATLNAARVLEAVAAMTGVDHAELSRLALRAPAGADGLVLVPYLEGERTPNLPTATGAVHGLTSHNATPAHLARAGVEGMLCGLADGLDALVSAGARPERVLLVGGAAASAAVRQIAPTVFGRPVQVPPPGEYVARGAAAQAAWVLSGSAEPPAWDQPGAELFEADAVPAVRERYASARALFLERPS